MPAMLMRADESALLVVDVQERLAPAIEGRATVLANIQRLLRGAALLSVPALASEQYPKGLGTTVGELAPLLPAQSRFPKLTFSCLAEPEAAARIRGLDRRQLVVAGMETHVCVLQTAIDLAVAGHTVYVVADACGSRTADNKAAGLARMQAAGVAVVTTEMVLFEWLGRAGSDDFRAVSALIK